MKTLRLRIDLTGIELKEEEKKLSPTQFSTRVIKNVLISYGEKQGPGKHYRGFNKVERKLLYSLTTLFKEAEEQKAEFVSLSDDEAKFIQRCFRDGVFIPNELVQKVEENVDNMKGEGKWII